MPLKQKPTPPLSQENFYNQLTKHRHRFSEMEPELEVTVRDPSMEVEGYVVVWNTGIAEDGPLGACGKGGTRVLPDLEIKDIKRLARAMAEKNAAAGLPLGGAKSGLKCDSKDPDYEKKYKRFVELCKPFLRENGGVFGGFGYDVGCLPPKNAHWAVEQLGSGKSFTGKPVEMGGTDYDREGIAGLGVAVAGRTLLKENGEKVEGASFAIQGLGAMGAAVLRYFSGYGAVLKTLSDPKYGGTWHFENGVSDELLNALIVQDLQSVKKRLHKEGRFISEDASQALYSDVDILFPCALEDSITEENVNFIEARFIAEGANNPTTEEAHRILYGKNILVVPDILANPGGIIAAYVEMTSSVSDEENAETGKKVSEAKLITEQRVEENVKTLLSIMKEVDVSPDQVGDYMSYQRLFV